MSNEAGQLPGTDVFTAGPPGAGHGYVPAPSTGTDDIEGSEDERPPRRRRRPVVLVTAALVVLAAGGGAVGLLGRDDDSASGAATTRTATATVTRTDLVQTQRVDGTLGYDGRYTVAGTGRSMVTWLPDVGDTLERGDRAYAVEGISVPLFYGGTPLFRELSSGVADGPDVRVLKRNLKKLGHGDELADDDHYSPGTADAVRRWQDALGREETGTVSPGDALVEPGPVRVTETLGIIGAPAEGPCSRSPVRNGSSPSTCRSRSSSSRGRAPPSASSCRAGRAPRARSPGSAPSPAPRRAATAARTPPVTRPRATPRSRSGSPSPAPGTSVRWTAPRSPSTSPATAVKTCWPSRSRPCWRSPRAGTRSRRRGPAGSRAARGVRPGQGRGVRQRTGRGHAGGGAAHMSDAGAARPSGAGAGDDAPVIRLEAVSKSYPGGVRALREASLDVRSGELLAVVGRSGSGKSTMLHLMGTLDRPSSGRVLLRGHDVAGLSDRKLSAVRARWIGFVFQQFFLSPAGPPSTTSPRACSTTASRRAGGARSRSPPCAGWAWATGSGISRTRCPGASDSGPPSRGPSPSAPR